MVILTKAKHSEGRAGMAGREKGWGIIRIAMSYHNQDYSVLPSSGLLCFVIVRNSMFCLIQFCNVWPSSVLPSSGIA